VSSTITAMASPSVTLNPRDGIFGAEGRLGADVWEFMGCSNG
jgi:hypothetical protein